MEIPGLGGVPRRALVVTPHPDDELWMGGAIALLSRAGASVSLTCMTRGEAGTDYLARDGERLQGEALARWRQGELEASAKILGVEEVSCWGLPDGGLDGLDEAELARVVGRLAERVDRLGRDGGVELVLTLGRDGIYGHRDHVAVTRWVEAALRRCGRPPVAFGVVFAPGVFDAQWKSFVKRRPELAVSDWIARGRGTPFGEEGWAVEIQTVEADKRAAILAHRSQLRGPDEASFFVPGTLPHMLGVERFERLG